MKGAALVSSALGTHWNDLSGCCPRDGVSTEIGLLDWQLSGEAYRMQNASLAGMVSLWGRRRGSKDPLENKDPNSLPSYSLIQESSPQSGGSS